MIQTRGRVRGIVALVVAVVVVLAIAIFAKTNAAPVFIGVIAVLVIAGAIMIAIGKRKTGLSITPEWKPETTRDDDDDAYDDLDDPSDDIDAPETPAAADDGANTPTSADQDANGAEPVRRLDAQILGADLSKLGQVISPKLAKSYAVGTLVLEGPSIVWEPGAVSRAAGIDDLVTAPEQVSVVEAAPLWGSWALIRVATAGGDEWCLRVPGSVDLSPAFAELGLTVHKTTV